MIRITDLYIRISEAKRQLSIVSTPTEDLIRSFLEKDRNIKEKSPEEQKRVLQTYIQKVITQNGMNPNDKSLEIHAIVDANVYAAQES